MSLLFSNRVKKKIPVITRTPKQTMRHLNTILMEIMMIIIYMLTPATTVCPHKIRLFTTAFCPVPHIQTINQIIHHKSSQPSFLASMTWTDPPVLQFLQLGPLFIHSYLYYFPIQICQFQQNKSPQTIYNRVQGFF